MRQRYRAALISPKTGTWEAAETTMRVCSSVAVATPGIASGSQVLVPGRIGAVSSGGAQAAAGRDNAGKYSITTSHRGTPLASLSLPHHSKHMGAGGEGDNEERNIAANKGTATTPPG